MYILRFWANSGPFKLWFLCTLLKHSIYLPLQAMSAVFGALELPSTVNLWYQIEKSWGNSHDPCSGQGRSVGSLIHWRCLKVSPPHRPTCRCQIMAVQNRICRRELLLGAREACNSKKHAKNPTFRLEYDAPLTIHIHIRSGLLSWLDSEARMTQSSF